MRPHFSSAKLGLAIVALLLNSIGTAFAAAPAITSAPAVDIFYDAQNPGNLQFAHRIMATNSPAAFDATGLPPDAWIDHATGWITGSRNAPGVYDVTVSASNAEGATTGTLRLAIHPAAVGVTSTQGAYWPGQSFAFAVHYNTAMTVTGVPRLNFAIGPASAPRFKDAIYTSGSGSNVLVFSYAVAPGDADLDGVQLLPTAPAGGMIVDASGLAPSGMLPVRYFASGITVAADAGAIPPGSGAFASKVTGAAVEVGPNILHPSGTIYDQVQLQGATATITADPGQVTRISFIDLNDDIVQVEFAGAGVLALSLEAASGPAPAAKYNQPGVNYIKGHASIVISGADETTNASVFSVGRANAINQALFQGVAASEGVADIASIAIFSANGKFGGLRTANTSYFNTAGLTGVYAPDVQFAGPVYVGNISAFDAAKPVLVLGACADVRITGGDLFQPNGAALQVSGLAQLQFKEGTTSHGALRAAQVNLGRLEQNSVDVTAELVGDR